MYNNIGTENSIEVLKKKKKHQTGLYSNTQQKFWSNRTDRKNDRTRN